MITCLRFERSMVTGRFVSYRTLGSAGSKLVQINSNVMAATANPPTVKQGVACQRNGKDGAMQPK